DPLGKFQGKVDEGFLDEQGRKELKHMCFFLVLSDGSTNPKNNNEDALVDGKEHDDDIQNSVSPDIHSSSCGFRNFNEEFEECINNSSNEVNAAGPSNAAMPNLEDLSHNADDVGTEADINNMESIISVSPIPTTRIHKDHPTSQIIEEPRRVHQALKDPSWIKAMQEELLQFKMQKVWILVDLPYGKRAIEEGIGYEEVFAPVARIEAIRLFLAYASFMGFPVYQMDVKSTFLYGTIEEEVYALCQSFEKLMKDKFQMSSMGELTFFLGLQVKQKKDGIFISQDKYVAEILRKFRLSEGKSASTPIDAEKPLLKDSDGEDVDVHTYRSMIGSLMYLTSSRPDIMFAVCACVRFQVTPKLSHLNAVKRIFRYLKGKPCLGLWYPYQNLSKLVAYSDSDYAGASLDRKSTTGGCQFLGCRLISSQCKKQTVVATSSTEAEYVDADSGCAQVLWMQNQLLDYSFYC
nr:uncharacterized mitochondrial protein AtMg00810-like [Tanacetum cinerariifolium]